MQQNEINPFRKRNRRFSKGSRQTRIKERLYTILFLSLGRQTEGCKQIIKTRLITKQHQDEKPQQKCNAKSVARLQGKEGS